MFFGFPSRALKPATPWVACWRCGLVLDPSVWSVLRVSWGGRLWRARSPFRAPAAPMALGSKLPRRRLSSGPTNALPAHVRAGGRRRSNAGGAPSGRRNARGLRCLTRCWQSEMVPTHAHRRRCSRGEVQLALPQDLMARAPVKQLRICASPGLG